MDLTSISQYKSKNCIKGIPCGNACISASKKCKSELAPKNGAVADEMDNPDNLAKGAEKLVIPDDDLDITTPPDGHEEWKAEPEEEEDRTFSEMLNPDAPPPTEVQAEAINAYTGSMYEPINGLLRNPAQFKKEFKDDPDYRKEVKDLASKTADGIRPLPDYKGETYRGSTLDDALVAKMKVGGTYSDKGFLSTSADKDIAEKFTDPTEGKTAVVFTIDGKHGKDVSKVAGFEYEKEVLYNPSSKFKITSMETIDGVLNVGMKQYGKQK